MMNTCKSFVEDAISVSISIEGRRGQIRVSSRIILISELWAQE